MRPTLTPLLALATTVTAISNQVIRNYCPEGKFITLLLNQTGVDGPFLLPSGQAYEYAINGTGNSVTVANVAADFGAAVPRLDLGTSTNNGIIYWAVNNLTGDPFADSNFNVTSSGKNENVCQSCVGYDKQVHACIDNDVTLFLSLCTINVA
ncbi:uncharacterized protein LTR77_001175 [Saxophila tyrrhenica]|uniref:Uncharacterized protein n=1 Tax=Saxophila tyrrhenica TaxID=1690608 RepID=A0AAV9PKB8_9PEZI|nr:hypothetical protein LTR77_001175 [Saxophila tyrrhenica]